MIGKILVTLSVACLAYGAPHNELSSVTGLSPGTGPGIVQTDVGTGLGEGHVFQGSDVSHTFSTGTGGIEVGAGGKTVVEGTGITEGFRKIETETPLVGGVSGHGFVHPVGVPSPTFKSGFNLDGGLTYTAPTGWWNGLGHQVPGFEYGKSLGHGSVGGYNGFVGEHTGIVGGHTGIVGKHTGIVGGHTGIVGKHTGIVGEHTGIVGGHTGIVGGHTGIVGGHHTGTVGSYSGIEGYSSTHGLHEPELWSGLYKSEYHDVHGKPSGLVPSAGLLTGLSGRNVIAGPVGVHGSEISGFGTTGLLPKIGEFGTSGVVSPKVAFPLPGTWGRNLYRTVNTYGTAGIVPKSYGFGTEGYYNNFYTTPYYNNQPAYGGYVPPATTTVQPVYGQVQPIYGQVQPAAPTYGQVQPTYVPGYGQPGYYPGQATYYPHSLYNFLKK